MNTNNSTVSQPADTPPPLEKWSNLHAPDMTAMSREANSPTSIRGLLAELAKNRTALLGGAFLFFVFIVAAAAPVLFPGDPLEMVARPFLWPGQNVTYPLGTDAMGRDVLAGIVHGARVSLSIGFLAAGIGTVVGIVVGSTAGYFGSYIDEILLFIIEIFQSIPGFILVVIIVAIAGSSAGVVACSISIVTWPTIARLVRSEFRSTREKDYVAAARSLGYGHARIIAREILPNALPPVIVTSTVMIATAVLMEAGLSFMGLTDPNIVSWGSMIGTGREVIRTAWYLTALPGFALVFTILSLNLVGDGLNDVLNPRLSEDR